MDAIGFSNCKLTWSPQTYSLKPLTVREIIKFAIFFTTSVWIPSIRRLKTRKKGEKIPFDPFIQLYLTKGGMLHKNCAVIYICFLYVCLYLYILYIIYICLCVCAWDVVAQWLRRWLSTVGSWVRLPLEPSRIGFLAYNFACALRRETPIQ